MYLDGKYLSKDKNPLFWVKVFDLTLLKYLQQTVQLFKRFNIKRLNIHNLIFI